MLAIIDISTLSPQFMQAVTRIHNAAVPIALLMCFGGFLFLVADAYREHSVQQIIPSMVRIFIVAILVGNGGSIGNWIESLVLGIEQESGVGNQTAFGDFLDQIKIKFGVDLGALNNAMPQGPANGPNSTPTGGTLLTHYAYPGDSTADSKSAQGIGAFDFSSAPGSLVPMQSAALTDSAAAQYHVSPGQSFTINANGQTYNLVYADRAPEADSRVDIYDPYNQLGGGNDFSANVTSFDNGPAVTSTGVNPVTDTFNALVHPAEAAQSAMMGVLMYFVSLLSVGVWWVMALLQSVLFYSEIAVSPLFIGALLIRGWEGVAKVFIASFIAICLWPIAFLITGLGTKLILSLALNTGNVSGLGQANTVGLSYFWMIAIVFWIFVGVVFGPWMLSRQLVQGASGVATMLVGAGRAASTVAQSSIGHVSKPAVGSIQSSSRMASRPPFSRYMRP